MSIYGNRRSKYVVIELLKCTREKEKEREEEENVKHKRERARYSSIERHANRQQ